MDSRVIKIETKYGEMFVVRRDDTIGRSLLHYGEWTQSELDVIGQLVKPGMVVADVGANIGTHTLAMARMVGPEGSVVSFEPQPFLFRILSANLLVNDCKNVVAINAAVANADGWLDIPEYDYEIPANFGAISVEGCSSELPAIKSSAPIPRLRLDGVPALRNAALIKIDVESMEKSVLAGADDLITRNRPVLYVENNYPGEKSKELIRFIASKNYTSYWDVAPKFSETNFFNKKENIFPREECINMLCVPTDRDYRIEKFKQVKDPDDHPRLDLL